MIACPFGDHPSTAHLDGFANNTPMMVIPRIYTAFIDVLQTTTISEDDNWMNNAAFKSDFNHL